MATKIIKPQKIQVALVTFSQVVPNIKDVFGAEQFLEAHKQTGFCGWRSAYWRDNFAVLQAKWQTQSIPAGAVEEEMQRLHESGNYQTLNKKELKEVAKDIVQSRVPYATSTKNIALVKYSPTAWFVIGINIGEAVFTTLLSKVSGAVELIRPITGNFRALLGNEDLTEVYMGVTLGGMEMADTMHIDTTSKWHGLKTGIALECNGGIRVGLGHIKGSCQDNDVVCSYVGVRAEDFNCHVGVGNTQTVDLLDAPDMAFDFSINAQNSGEAAGNAEYWHNVLHDTACGLFVLSGSRKA